MADTKYISKITVNDEEYSLKDAEARTSIPTKVSELENDAGYLGTTIIVNNNNYDYVDLGLESGTLWATMNVGASSVEDYGSHYAWGETETKSDYSWDTYLCTNSECQTSSDPIYADGLTDIAGSKYDVVTTMWGGDWKMPTSTQVTELINNCTWKWTTQNDVNGYLVTGINGNNIFLPATGWQSSTSVSDEGNEANYWSSTQLGTYSYGAGNLRLDSASKTLSDARRSDGLSVRGVIIAASTTSLDEEPTEGSENAVKSDGLYSITKTYSAALNAIVAACGLSTEGEYVPVNDMLVGTGSIKMALEILANKIDAISESITDLETRVTTLEE